jgi:periplasmic mercuric ion binding protein
MKAIFIFSLLLLTSFTLTKSRTNLVVEIKTSSECDDCKERIESALNNTKGVKYAELNVKTKVVTVKYNSKKTSLEKIKLVINQTGYAADDSPADSNALNKLPKCCQPGGMK